MAPTLLAQSLKLGQFIPWLPMHARGATSLDLGTHISMHRPMGLPATYESARLAVLEHTKLMVQLRVDDH